MLDRYDVIVFLGETSDLRVKIKGSKSMWFHGEVQLARSARFDVKRINTHRISWQPRVPNYGVPVTISPWQFAYAVARTSAIGIGLRLPGKLAGLGFSVACLTHLVRDGLSNLKADPDFNLLKDFVGTSLKGVIGAALTYREMQTLGYHNAQAESFMKTLEVEEVYLAGYETFAAIRRQIDQCCADEPI